MQIFHCGKKAIDLSLITFHHNIDYYLLIFNSTCREVRHS